MTTDLRAEPAEGGVGGEGAERQEKHEPRRVGYRRPPPGRPFRPGQSGNPKGRPKRARTLAEALARALKTRIEATGDGRRRTKLEAAMTKVADGAARGDPHALSFLRAMYRGESESPPPPPEPKRYGANDSLVVAEIIRRFSRPSAPPSAPAAAPPNGSDAAPPVAQASSAPESGAAGAPGAGGGAHAGGAQSETRGGSPVEKAPETVPRVRLTHPDKNVGSNIRGVSYRLGEDGTVLVPADAVVDFLPFGYVVVGT